MAITKTNKLGLPLYSAGTDPHPGRVDHNEIMQAINDNAMGVKQGLHAERPGAGVAGRTYFSTDRNTAAYDNGTTWVEYVPIGGLAPSGVRAGATGPVLDGTGGNEGMSTKLARADHTHAVPLATDDLPGLMNSDMFYLLARMTDAATPSTVVRRDAAARISVGTPTSAAHASTKAYADLVASDALRLTTGTIPAARLPLATASAAGAMSAADKATFDAATGTNTGSAIVRRYSDGTFTTQQISLVGTPTHVAHATRKDYVDGLNTGARAYADSLVGTSAAPLAHQHDAADVNSGVFAAARLPLASASAAGALSAAHFLLLNSATPAATPSTLVRNDLNGRFQTVAPASAADVANKGYVDGKTWSGADITTGTVSPDRIPKATSSLDGLMPKGDKAIFDARTTTATPLSIPWRNSFGNTNFNAVLLDAAAPTAANNATRKDYVDAQDAKRVSLGGEVSGTDLNTVTAPGDYYASTAGGATVANNFPVNSGVGTLSVRRFSGSNVWVIQTYTVWNSRRVFVRSTNSETNWSAWTEQASADYASNASNLTSGVVDPARIANATSALDGLMPKSDKTKLDAATAAATGGTIPLRDANGNVQFGVVIINSAVSSDKHAATKEYVDGKKWAAEDVVSGTFTAARLPVATQSVHGAMPALDKKKLDSAASANVSGTLIERDAQGNANVSEPTAKSHIATKGYVDGGAWTALSVRAGFTAQGLMIRKTANNTVRIRGSITRTAGPYPTSGYETVATLPSWAIPATFNRFAGGGYASGNANGLIVQADTTGNLQIGGVGNSAADAYMAFEWDL